MLGVVVFVLHHFLRLHTLCPVVINVGMSSGLCENALGG
jgi:hypothetical protein